MKMMIAQEYRKHWRNIDQSYSNMLKGSMFSLNTRSKAIKAQLSKRIQITKVQELMVQAFLETHSKSTLNSVKPKSKWKALMTLTHRSSNKNYMLSVKTSIDSIISINNSLHK